MATFGESTGDDAIRTLLPLIAVTALGLGGGLLGLLNALPFLWYLAAHRTVGAAVDALGHRRAVLLGNGLRLLTVSALILLLATDLLSTITLLILAALIGLGDALFTTGHSAMVPAVVGRERTAACYQRIEAVGAVARVSGPAAVSALLRLASPAVALGLGLGAYLLSLLTLATTLLNAAAMISGTALVLFALGSLGLAPATVALFTAAAALGALAGAAGSGPLRARLPTGSAKLLATGGVALGSLVAPAALLVPTGQAAMLGIGEFLVAVCATTSAIVGSDVPARLVPQQQLGRAFAAIRLLTIGVMPVASVLGGLFIAVTSPVAALLGAAAIATLACLPLARIRHWSPPPPEEEPS